MQQSPDLYTLYNAGHIPSVPLQTNLQAPTIEMPFSGLPRPLHSGEVSHIGRSWKQILGTLARELSIPIIASVALTIFFPQIGIPCIAASIGFLAGRCIQQIQIPGEAATAFEKFQTAALWLRKQAFTLQILVWAVLFAIAAIAPIPGAIAISIFASLYGSSTEARTQKNCCSSWYTSFIPCLKTKS